MIKVGTSLTDKFEIGQTEYAILAGFDNSNFFATSRKVYSWDLVFPIFSVLDFFVWHAQLSVFFDVILAPQVEFLLKLLTSFVIGVVTIRHTLAQHFGGWWRF